MHAYFKTFNTSWYPAFIRFLGSRGALFLIALLFGFQALWVALTLRYPGAFDENFHLGLIKIYSHHWLPFLSGQPPSAEVYGAVARDPSYLYHYLMSFPYRLVALVTDSQKTQIIVLRLINITFMVGGILAFARALKRTPLSAPLRNAVLLFFTSIPIVPLMAGQISYDNLFLPLVALVMLLSFGFVQRLRDDVFDGRKLTGLLILCMLASLVKYAFLPMFMSLMFYLIYEIYAFCKRTGTKLSVSLLRHIRPSKKPIYIAYATLLIVTGVLFAQRYGVNLVRYHTPVPDCAQVLTAKECEHYSPWGRDNDFAKANVGVPRENAFIYMYRWLQQMMMELFFTVYGVFLPNDIVDYRVGMPIRILLNTGWVILSAGFAFSLIFARKLWRNSSLRIIAVVSGVYTASLLIQNYLMYLATAAPVAIHGRYILPLVPFILAWFCLSAWEAVHYVSVSPWLKFPKSVVPAIKTAGFVTLILLTTQGGGIITYILRSDDTWVWQQSTHAPKVNNFARSILKPVVTD